MVCLNRGTQFFHFINQHGPCPQHCFFKKNRYNKVEFTYIYYFDLDKREIMGFIEEIPFISFPKKISVLLQETTVAAQSILQSEVKDMRICLSLKRFSDVRKELN